MDSYLEISLLSDLEFSSAVLMNALFSKLHRALVEHGRGEIGVSFPDVEKNDRSLGEHLRLHSSKESLERLMNVDWMIGIKDHTKATEILGIPSGSKAKIVRRVQAKSSPERQRRRLIARKGISAEQAIRAIPDSAAERLKLPYLVLTSQSTGQQFRLFVEHSAVQDYQIKGRFSAYGLSSVATIPWF